MCSFPHAIAAQFHVASNFTAAPLRMFLDVVETLYTFIIYLFISTVTSSLALEQS